MALTKDRPYPSDEIAALNGFDGSEAKNVSDWCRKYETEFVARIVFALNQHYPELQSEHYLDKALIVRKWWNMMVPLIKTQKAIIAVPSVLIWPSKLLNL